LIYRHHIGKIETTDQISKEVDLLHDTLCNAAIKASPKPKKSTKSKKSKIWNKEIAKAYAQSKETTGRRPADKRIQGMIPF
jgi:hypothetical protein